MTPQQLIENGKECARLQEKIEILESKDCYLIVGNNNVFFRTSHHTALANLTDEQKGILRTVADTIKANVITEYQQTMQELTQG